MDRQALSEWIGRHEDEMIELQTELTARPALAPENGGQGEWEKARFLEEYLREHGLDQIEHYDCPDERVPEGTRPNLVATVPGLHERPCIWVLCHMDVVPPGEKLPDGSWKGWESDPWTVHRAGDMLVGRGVTDNQQSIVTSVFAARALIECDVRPPQTVKLLFVADEETHSVYGLEYVLREHRDLFDSSDLIIVPDGGNEDGSMIEIAEKSVLWLEFRVRGQQAHASRPDYGTNAFRAGSRLVALLDEGLSHRFDRVDHLYEPPTSTFEPTLHAANVPNVNTIPGEDLFCFDCRVLPHYKLDAIIHFAMAQCRQIDGALDTETELVVRGRQDAPPPTPADARVVELLKPAIQQVYRVTPRPMGIGGMTVASPFRARGFQAAVWMTSSGTEHQVNELCSVANMVGDARVFARVFSTEA